MGMGSPANLTFFPRSGKANGRVAIAAAIGMNSLGLKAGGRKGMANSSEKGTRERGEIRKRTTSSDS